MTFKKLFIFGILGLIFFLPTITLAQNTGVTGYTPLAPIPELMNKAGNQVDINSFIPGAIKLAISIASALSVIYIIVGGVQYITTDSMGGKSNAKGTIENAIMGLLLAIGSYAILYTINPKLVVFDIKLSELEGVGIDFDGVRNGPIVTPTTEDISKSLEGCNDCAQIPSGVRYKSAQANGCAMPGPCVVNREVGQKLLTLTNSLSRSGISFQVTESWPPTRPHVDSCQNPNNPDSGTCVDANFINAINLASPSDRTKVESFILAAQAAGLRAVYEVTNIGDRDRLISGNLDSGDVIAPRMNVCVSGETTALNASTNRYSPCCPTKELKNNPGNITCSWISANHFSVYNK